MEYLRDLAGWASQFEWLPDFWGFGLITIDGKPITLGTLITGVVLLVLGYFLCRQLSKWFGRKVLSRLDIEESLKHTLQTMIFYVLLIVLTLFVLSLLKVPVTIFTVLGGALAIGVGFGSQNIVNNFISGLIIMIERPVRVGDFIEMEALGGRVEHIGARSTRIKSIDNTHIVVPNSSFLEKNVLNWTLSDNLVRTQVKVGVAYGSDTERVESILKQAAGEEEFVLKYPEPLVVFADFGDNSLNFEIHFWTHLTDMMNLKLLQSRLRFRIDYLFREHGVVISFPQRDVHLDTLRPLQIELLKSKD